MKENWAIETCDPKGMRELLATFPEQCAQAIEIGGSTMSGLPGPRRSWSRAWEGQPSGATF